MLLPRIHHTILILLLIKLQEPIIHQAWDILVLHLLQLRVFLPQLGQLLPLLLHLSLHFLLLLQLHLQLSCSVLLYLLGLSNLLLGPSPLGIDGQQLV